MHQHYNFVCGLFEQALSLSCEELSCILYGYDDIPWNEFLLNPRRLRGSDFIMRWSQGVWSEQRLIQVINETEEFFALPYGPSSIAPNNNIRDFELYFERLEQAGLGKLKRPDLLLFQRCDQEKIYNILSDLGGVEELPFLSEDVPGIRQLLSHAIVAIECENSLWVANDMPDYGVPLKPQRRLGGKLGLKKSAVLPTIILKEEDKKPLMDWQQQRGVAIHIWHVFYDLAFGIALDRVNELITQGFIEPTVQRFQAPGGSTTEKTIYKVYYHYAYHVGFSEEEPRLVADYIKDKNGHILPFVRFEGGRLCINQEVHQLLLNM